MRTDLERGDFIMMLSRLDSEEDADIIAAVRDIQAKMTVAGVTWDDLLRSQDEEQDDYQPDYAPEDDDEYEDDDDEEDDDDDNDDEDDEEDDDEDNDRKDDHNDNDDEDFNPLSDEEKKEAADIISAIGKMKISDATKKELAEYTDDIKEGEFEQMDLRYLRALKTRLSA
jgi:hypothetical protein